MFEMKANAQIEIILKCFLSKASQYILPVAKHHVEI